MHILLIEDDRETAVAIGDLLAREGLTSEHVMHAEPALARAGDAAVDVVLMDRMLPDADGIDLVTRMRAAGIEKPVLMLSALGSCAHRTEGLDAGVDDYLPKPFDREELVARLRALFRRTSVQARQPILIHGDIELHVRARTAHRGGRHLALSPKEFDLLKFLMEHAGEVVTREMLLRQVWNLSFDPQTNVIDVNLVRLRRKLEQGSATACLETVWGRGYRLNALLDAEA